MELGGRPGGVALVASRAIGRRCHVVGVLAGGIGTVVATGAGGGTGEGAVVSLGTLPFGGGGVAGLTTRSGGKMTVVLAAGNRAVVATRAASRNRNIDVELGRRPGGVALVASRAIGAGADVVGILASGVGTVMATGANSGAREGAVIGFGTGPDRGGFMTALAGCRGSQMRGCFARRRGAVVAT